MQVVPQLQTYKDVSIHLKWQARQAHCERLFREKPSLATSCKKSYLQFTTSLRRVHSKTSGRVKCAQNQHCTLPSPHWNMMVALSFHFSTGGTVKSVRVDPLERLQKTEDEDTDSPFSRAKSLTTARATKQCFGIFKWKNILVQVLPGSQLRIYGDTFKLIRQITILKKNGQKCWQSKYKSNYRVLIVKVK